MLDAVDSGMGIGACSSSVFPACKSPWSLLSHLRLPLLLLLLLQDEPWAALLGGCPPGCAAGPAGS
jgi:hypothetical protein